MGIYSGRKTTTETTVTSSGRYPSESLSLCVGQLNPKLSWWQERRWESRSLEVSDYGRLTSVCEWRHLRSVPMLWMEMTCPGWRSLPSVGLPSPVVTRVGWVKKTMFHPYPYRKEDILYKPIPLRNRSLNLRIHNSSPYRGNQSFLPGKEKDHIDLVASPIHPL